ncbi:helix-turn-helix transcriptional regulator [Nocardia puris]|uniref:ArsR/SmtB family transcription factor n=1 Tax=Nocardia puris TaxID=208602 RepID=UPI000A027CDE|nr:metalloregulator ArsR/SmtB family transcription factor [Nocardia puris]MBF6211644.1 helix-turn-helix transcriptional regulator [Nocardia puris]MBF6365647.1 helix-turn-helix transcriptional regulator [Nocardia puris]MBF6460710.1 helix-turn-helix transcriptional regulator [Nocardia puris]
MPAELPHPETADLELASVLHALSDPVRLQLVACLACDEGENCGDLSQHIALHKSTLSHHYRVLREAGITRTTIRGRTRVMRLRYEDLHARFPGLLDVVFRGLVDMIEEQWDGSAEDREKLLAALRRPVAPGRYSGAAAK